MLVIRYDALTNVLRSTCLFLSFDRITYDSSPMMKKELNPTPHAEMCVCVCVLVLKRKNDNILRYKLI